MIAEVEVRTCLECDCELAEDHAGDECDECALNEYPYAKLSDTAKETARQWYSDGEAQDWSPAWDCHLGPLAWLGIVVDNTCRGSSSIARPDVDFSVGGNGGFCSAEATWHASGCDMSKLVEDCPKDEVLRRICAQLSVLAMRYPDAVVYMRRADGRGGSDAEARLVRGFPDGMDETDDGEGEVLAGELGDQFNNINHWLLSALESDYEDCFDTERIEEGIEANEYKFDRDGNAV